MTRTTILLDDDLWLEIKQLARTRGTTSTEVIREALKSYPEENRSKRKLSFTGVGRSGPFIHRQGFPKDSQAQGRSTRGLVMAIIVDTGPLHGSHP